MQKTRNNPVELIILFLAAVLPLVFLTATRDTFLIKQTLLSTAVPLMLILVIIKRVKLPRVKLLFPLTAFTVIMLLSLLNTKNISVSINALSDKLVFIGLYFIIAVHNNENFRIKIINTSLIAGFLVCVYGILQLTGLDFIEWARVFGGRMSSSLGNPNFLAGYLAALIPVSIASTIVTGNKPRKILLLANTVFLITCLVLTQTRGSWLGFIASVLVFLILAGGALNKITRRRIYAGSAVIVILISAYITLADNSYTGKFKSIFNPNIASIYERVFKWRTASEMIKDHPLLGVGMGAVKVNYALYQEKARKKMRIVLRGTSESQVHNEYMQIWAEAGILGLISFLGIIIVFFSGALKYLKTLEKKQKWIVIGIISAVAGILIDSISNFPLHIVPTGFLFWTYLAMTEDNKTESGREETSAGKPVQIISGAILSLIIVLAWVKTTPVEFAADIHRSNADLANNAENWQLAITEYEKAHRLSPVNGRICYDLGMAYVNIKDYDNAIIAFRESIKIRNYGEVYNDLANCYYLKGMKTEAIENWEVAVRLELPDPYAQEKVENNLKILKKQR